MLRQLGLIAVIGLTSSMVLLAAAVWFSGRGLANQGYGWGKWRSSCEEISSNQKQVTLPYGGNQALMIDLPGLVTYQPDGEAEITVTGDETLVDHVWIGDGKLSLDCDPGSKEFKLEVHIKGYVIEDWTLVGRANLTMIKLEQAILQLRMRGSGNIVAAGNAEELKLDLTGAGSAYLKDFIAQSAKIDVRGSGNVQATVKKDAEISIFGSGNVELSGNPTLHRSDMRGSGRIVATP